MTWERINFVDRDDTKPDTYIVDGVEKEIIKDDSGLNQAGTDLNAENLNKIDQQLYDLSTPAYSTIANTKLAITPFTVGTLDAPMKYQMEGVSVANSMYSIDGNSNIVSLDDILYLGEDGSFAPSPTIQRFNSKLGDKYFILASFEESLVNRIFSNNGVGAVNFNFSNTNEVYGSFEMLGDNATNFIAIRVGLGGTLTDNKAFVINMTQYGITDFTEAQMLDLVHAMQAGTDIQSAIVNINSVGKNLFDKTQYTDVDYAYKIKIDPSEQFTWSESIAYKLYDLQDNEVSSGTSTTVTGGERAYKIAFANTITDVESFQLEKGTATAYEPYKQNSLQPNIELKSVPTISDTLVNAVVDPADSNKLLRLDKAVHTKNVQEHVLQESDIVSMTDRNNVAYATTKSFGDAKQFLDSVTDFNLVNGWKEVDGSSTSLWDVAGNDTNNSYTTNTNNTFYFLFPLGTSLATAQADLAGTVIQYQLDEPVATELSLDEMYSFENGVLYQNGIPASIDYTTATNQAAVLDELNKKVEKLDDKTKHVEAGTATALEEVTFDVAFAQIPVVFPTDVTSITTTGFTMNGTGGDYIVVQK